MFKRIALFLFTNILIITLVSLVMFVLSMYFWINIEEYLSSYIGLLAFCSIFWFAWSFISLSLSKWMAKRAHKIKLLTKDNFYDLSDKEKLVYETVENLAEVNQIKMPEVWVYSSNDINAFATWPSKNNSIVAVSTALLENMQKDEIEWVVAHEISHVVSWDMVTMSLMQWIVNTFVIFFSRIITRIIDSYLDEWLSNMSYYFINITLQTIFWLLASILVMKFSRYREFKADEWSAKFVWKEKMIKALKALDKTTNIIWKDLQLATMKINDKKRTWIQKLLSSHPSIEERIQKLENIIL